MKRTTRSAPAEVAGRQTGARGPRRAALVLGLLGLLLLALPATASASHGRFFSLSWTETGANTAEFRAIAGYNCFNNCPPLGASSNTGSVNSEGIDTGDGDSISPEFVVIARNPGENYYIAEGRANATDGNAISHTYASPGPFTAQISSCCTIGELNNAANGDYRAGTLVDMGADDESPRSSVPPVVNVGTSGQQTYNVPASDPGGERLRWRLATGTEACGGCSNPQPPGDFAIDPNTGRVTWTTTNQPAGLYFSSVVIEALDSANAVISATQVTYLVRVGSGGVANQPPRFDPPSPPDLSRFQVAPGDTLELQFQASDPDVLDSVSFNNLGLPDGATFTQAPGNPGTGTFSWTPRSDQTGEHQLTVIAQDSQDPPASVSRTYFIDVSEEAAAPDTTAPTSTASVPGCTRSGDVTVTVEDDQGGSGAKAVRYRIDGGAEQTAATSGQPGVATATVPEGRHSLEFWGEDQAGNQEADHTTVNVVVDRTDPTVAITSDQDTRQYRQGENASVTVSAADSNSGLARDPSAAGIALDTSRIGTFDIQRTAEDNCANVFTRRFEFEVLEATLASLPDPEVAETANADPSGTVRVRRPGSDEFVLLRRTDQIPIGSTLDTRKGSILLVTASNRRGGTQRGRFSKGIFQLLQNRAKRPVTTLALKGASFRRCGTPSAAPGKGSAARLSRRARRRLSSSARGSYRTRGRHSAATIRGTVWTTVDRCDGTLTRVARGTVVVRDFRLRRNIVVSAGKSYLALSPAGAAQRRADAERRRAQQRRAPSFTG
jgi:hypothetical protein